MPVVGKNIFMFKSSVFAENPDYNMKIHSRFKTISFKLGLLFSSIFLVLLLILGSVLYSVFTHIFIDYIKQDIMTRGNNHARILEGNFDRSTINHVIEMERGVTTEVLIADKNQKILGASKTIDQEMKEHLAKPLGAKGLILEEDWRKHKYIISASPIANNNGYVFMYYPSQILREIVYVMNILILVAGTGIILLAFGLIGTLSRKLTRPLLIMKEATSQMAFGRYRQKIPVIGEDEIAQLGNSIQGLGEQLQYYEESRNEFLASVAHELRTPLTYIKGYSDILNKGIINKPEEQAEYLKIINKESNRLAFMINDLFEMSKLQVGKFELKKQPSNINEIIERAAISLKPAASKKDINLLLDLAPDLPKVEVDAQRMEQVFYNLIENGIKYTTEGNIAVRSFPLNEFIVVEITDTGEGIPEAELPRIWERFYRVDHSRTRKTGGTGLGLYVVKEIVEAHQGNVKVKSTVNEGSVFAVYLKKDNG